MFMNKMACFWILLGTSSKRYGSEALMVNQKIGTSWMQGLQWYSMRNSLKRNVIEMFHVAPGSCTNGLLWIYLAKVQKEYASRRSNGEPKKLAQVECKVFNGTPWENSPKRNVIEMFHVAPGSCTNGQFMDLFGKGSKEICIESSNGETKKIGTSWMQGLQWYSMRKLTRKKCNWNVFMWPQVHAQMACYEFIWAKVQKRYCIGKL